MEWGLPPATVTTMRPVHNVALRVMTEPLSKRRERLQSATSAVLLLGFVIVFPMVVMRLFALGTDIVTEDQVGSLPGEPVEAVIVPGARVFTSGRPSGALLSRIELAEEIVAVTPGASVFASGGPGEPEVIAEYLPELEVVLDPEGLSTNETCKNAAAAGLQRVAVVTQPRHRVRTAALCESAGLDTLVVTTPQGNERASRLPERFARERVAEYWAILTISARWVGL